MTVPVKNRGNGLGEFEPGDLLMPEHGGTGLNSLTGLIEALGINEKLNKDDYVQHFRGVFSSYAALVSALPTALDGDYAHIDSGTTFDRLVAIWDSSDTKWVVNQAQTLSNTDEVPEGSQNLYFTVERVKNLLLGALTPQQALEISASDKLIEALGKLQAQITAGGGTTHWVDLSSFGTYHASVDKTWSKLEVAKVKGEFHFRGRLRVTAAIGSSENIWYAANQPATNWFLSAPLPPDMTGFKTGLLPAFVNNTISQNLFYFNQVPTLNMLSFNSSSNISANGFYYLKHSNLGELLNP